MCDQEKLLSKARLAKGSECLGGKQHRASYFTQTARGMIDPHPIAGDRFMLFGTGEKQKITPLSMK